MIPCLAQICSLNSKFDADVDEYAAGGCQAIEIWLTKLEEFLSTHGLDEVRQLREKHEVAFPVASIQYGLLESQGSRREESWKLFLRRLELCRDLEIGILIVACDVSGPLSQQILDRVAASLVQIADEAGRHKVRAALEFQASASFGNNLQTAAALVADVGSPSLGLCLDAFHYHVGPSKLDDLRCLTRDNLFHVQFSDLADVPRELATDSDRILPGEGEIALPAIIDRLREIDYLGHVSIELMNPRIWQVPALQFGEIGMAALRNLLAKE